MEGSSLARRRGVTTGRARSLARACLPSFETVWRALVAPLAAAAAAAAAREDGTAASHSQPAPPFALRSKHWRRIGFQTDDPAAELRGGDGGGGGALTLRALEYFVASQTSHAKRIAREQRRSGPRPRVTLTRLIFACALSAAQGGASGGAASPGGPRTPRARRRRAAAARPFSALSPHPPSAPRRE